MIEFAANEDHWVDHLAPIYEEMPAEHRGTFHAGRKVTEAAMERHSNIEFQISTGGISKAITVCASISDALNAKSHGRTPILVEHGAGQSYSDRNGSYPGGLGRGDLLGVLAPNEQAAERHKRFYPKGPRVVVIGSPRVDDLVVRYGNLDASPNRPNVVLSWHWDNGELPETGNAFDALGRGVLIELLRMQGNGWIDVIGHHHPRFPQAANLYDDFGVRVLENFDDVCAVADIYMADNTSTLFEMAALDRPVIVMNSPTYRRRTNHGLRFWEYADVGPNVWHSTEVGYAVSVAVEDGPALQKRRREVAEEVYPYRFFAAQRAVSAILSMAGLA